MYYKHILVCIDLEKKPEKIVQKAIELSEIYSSKLSLCHVIDEFIPIVCTTELELNVRDKIIANVKNKTFHLAKKFGIPKTDVFFGMGSIAREILIITKEIDVDLVIIGGHSAHHYFAWLVGTKEGTIANKAVCDVLIIHSK